MALLLSGQNSMKCSVMENVKEKWTCKDSSVKTFKFPLWEGEKSENLIDISFKT